MATGKKALREVRLGEIALDAVDIEFRAQTTLGLSTTAAETAALPEGLYMLWCTAEAYIKIDEEDATDVTTGNGYRLPANTNVRFLVRRDRKIGGILAASTATLRFHKVG